MTMCGDSSVGSHRMPFRNISILLVCQLISATGSIVLVTLGGIIGSELTTIPAIATLPVSLMIVSVAATAIPATILMRRIGRKYGSALASLSAIASMLLASYALHLRSFAGFAAAAAIFGINMAFTQQYRYAAAESVPPKYAARAISFVLLGAIGGAIVGPVLVDVGHFIIDGVPYAGTLVACAVLYVGQAVLFLFLGPLRGEEQVAGRRESRTLRTIVAQPVFLVAVLGGTVAYGVMSLIMTATPISMHMNDGFTLTETANVIRWHVLGMYVPSLVSGFLIDWQGPSRIMAAGATGLTVASVIGLSGHSLMHYWWALVLLGVGWNFLYVGATTLLTRTYFMSERFRAQAVNEFSVFGVTAAASLLAGTSMHFFGWDVALLMPLPLLAMIFIGIFIVRRVSPVVPAS
ncbi:MAG: MFS transporter [Gammaproteobacteria bacterium]|nr:MFS transporter [Gammaproteobacteria bacterium]